MIIKMSFSHTQRCRSGTPRYTVTFGGPWILVGGGASHMGHSKMIKGQFLPFMNGEWEFQILLKLPTTAGFHTYIA